MQEKLKRFFTWQLFLLLSLYAIGFQLVLELSEWITTGHSFSSLGTFLKDFIVNYPNLVLICFLNYLLIIWLNKRLPWEDKRNLLKRLFYEFFLAVSIVALQVVVINIIIALVISEPINFQQYFFSAIIGVIINLILLTTMEFYFLYIRRYEVALDNEWLKKENLSFQYRLLKNQINPHFLFNNLNTLSSLVSLDAGRAKQFIRKLSNVYRHVLEYGEQHLIPLKEEAIFIERYIYLLQTRFTKDLIIDINLKKEDLNKKIVPMALQILIENAIKHNAVFEDQPLEISIYSNGDSVFVENNLQRKNNVPSWGIGLTNLRNSYSLYRASLEIIESKTHFKVILPLLSHDASRNN